jgi:hypothetical protein
MPGDPRGRALGQLRQYGSAWDIAPRSDGFAAFADDPATGGFAYEQLEKQAIREGVWALQDDKARLENQIVAEREPHAEELARVKDKHDNDALLGSLTRFMAASSAPAEPKKTLLQEAREERAAKEADAAKKREAEFRQSVAEQMEMYPPNEKWSHLYSCLMRNRLPCDTGSRCPAPQICQAAAGDGSVLSWSPWTVDECDCPRLFFRPERIRGLRARITRQGREKAYADHNRH